MEKPKIKRELAIMSAFKNSYTIFFYATPDTASSIKEFGKVAFYGNDLYDITIDRRFDFDEVLNYIKSLGESQ